MQADEKHQVFNKYVTLTLDKEFFALAISSVREIQDMTDITRIPQTPEHMRGVVNLRGNAVPVIDLKQKFHMGATEKTINTRIIIMEVASGSDIMLLGVLADSVKEVIELEEHQLDPPPKMGAAVNAAFLRGIAKHNGKFILVLDIDKVFSDEEINTIQPEAVLSDAA